MQRPAVVFRHLVGLMLGLAVVGGLLWAILTMTGSPDEVRTVEDGSSASEYWLALAVVGLGGSVVVGGVWWMQRGRLARSDEDDPLSTPPETPGLGVRVVESVRWPTIAILVIGAAAASPLLITGAMDLSTKGENVLGGIAVLAGSALLAVLLRWYQGRDGVWATDTHLVARRRGQVSRWSWDEVEALGFSVRAGSAHYPVARLDRRRNEIVGPDAWVVLAKPVQGPFRGHEGAQRMHRLADDHGLPYTEALTHHDVFGR